MFLLTDEVSIVVALVICVLRLQSKADGTFGVVRAVGRVTIKLSSSASDGSSSQNGRGSLETHVGEGYPFSFLLSGVV